MRVLAPWWAALALVCSPVFAAETLTLAYPVFPGYLNAQGQGLYGDLMRAVYPAPQYEVRVEIVPFARALAMLASSDRVIVPGTNAPGLQAIKSQHISDVDVVSAAVLRAHAGDWQGISSLRHRRVAAQLGYAYQRYTDVPMLYEEKHDLGAMLRMLVRGRLDAVLDYGPRIAEALKTLPVEQAQAVEIKPAVLQQALYFAFRSSPEGEALRDRFDVEFQRMARSGELRALFQRHAMIAEAAYPPILRQTAGR